jgi:hypothetical protein
MCPNPYRSWLGVRRTTPILRGDRTVGTSLTPEFWERFAVLLVAAIGLTCVLTALFDTLAVRLLRRRVRGQSQRSGTASRVADHRVSVRT